MIITEKMRYDLLYLLDMAKRNAMSRDDGDACESKQLEAKEDMSRILKLENFLIYGEVKN